MQKLNTQSSVLSTTVVAGLVLAGQVASAEEPKQAVDGTLDATTFIATKFEKQLGDVANSVAVLDVEQLREEGKISVKEAIGYKTPGVIVTSTAGQAGKPASLFIRGTKTNQSQVRVDGVRISGTTSSYANFLGNANLFGLSDIEILKGASSSVYGAGAIGGVVSLSTAKGEGAPSYTATGEYGSYNSWLGNLGAQGQVGDFSYNVGASIEDTQNDSDSIVDGNDFNQKSYFARFDYAIDKNASVGMTVRVGDSYFETPERGNPVTGDTQRNHYDSLFTTLFYSNQVTDAWNTRLTFGYSKEDSDSRGYAADYFTPGSYVTSDFDTNTDRYSIYWDNEYVWSDAHTSVIGSYFENVDYASDGTYGANQSQRDTFGVYLNHAWQVIDALQLSGSVGWEDHDDFSDEWTWNAGLLYEVYQGTILRANAGRGLRAPTPGELENSVYLEPESSLSWDIGLEQEIGTGRVAVTWFESDIDDYINFVGYDPVTYVLTYENVSRKASGLEFAADADLEQINSVVYASYTYYQRTLDTIIPQQTASAGIDTQITDAIQAGLVATWVDDRTSSDPFVDTLESYFLLDVYGNYQVNENLKLHARVENLFDEDYLLGDFSGSFGDLNAVKGRGRGFYAGATLNF